jgi:hypothetical protein
MNENPIPFPNPIDSEDRNASVMIYLQRAVFWGEISIRKQFKASTWLSTNGVPDIISLKNPMAFFESSMTQPKQVLLHQLLIPNNLIHAYHLVPPNFDPVDYDPNEPNMQICLVDAFFGSYQINGKLRISTKQTLLTYLEITHIAYLWLYEVAIQNPFMPGLGIMKVPFALIRKESMVLNLIR